MTTTVSFLLPAEIVAGAQEAILLGDFNEWNPSEAVRLHKLEDGSMKADIALQPGLTYQYRYLLSDGRWVNDYSDKTWTEAFGAVVENCIVAVPAIQPKATAKAKPAKAKQTKAANDLTQIEGIGKKIAELLQKEGIDSFSKLSKTSIKKLQALLESAGPKFQLHNPQTWPKQAKLAAAGNWDALKKWQSELTGGKKK